MSAVTLRRADWLTAPINFGACDLCAHGTTVDGERMCIAAEVMPAPGTPVPVSAARSGGGMCGPDAVYLDFPGLKA